MKTRIFNPGFEFIFTLAILAIFGLPPLVMAQNAKDIQISITNGDTTVNGKSIKDLTQKERQEALKDINTIASIPPAAPQPPMANGQRMKRTYRFQKKDSVVAFNYHVSPDERKMAMHSRADERMRERNPAFDFDRKNSQVFNYITTDNNGISTHVTYRVSEPTDGLSHVGTDPDRKDQHEKLNLTDLNIVPQFSAGKTVIMFSLPSSLAADVQFEDSKGNLIWSAKATGGSFTKAFPLGLNGVYYLRVEQKGKLAVKKILRDQM
ncbi:MAG: hypothetical protein ACTHNW_00155 [Mucilaginibacter sp.]